MSIARVFKVASIFDGEIRESDLVLDEEDLPAVEDGEYLVEALYLSVDPYMRAYAKTFAVGQIMIGAQVAKVVESKNAQHPAGQIIVGQLGWRTHTIIKQPNDYHIRALPEIGHLPKSLALGVLGMPGATAYFGFLEVCRPAEGDTVAITTAAGAVGSHVGQLARIKGCRVVGITGSEDKARWLETLGFHYVINYKTTPNLESELKKAAPNGIDCYFDNVGGEISTTVMLQMNTGGRVAVCGTISAYNSKNAVRASIVQPAILFNQLEVKGFTVLQYQDRMFEAIEQNLKWVQQGKLKYRETITDGFENTLKALIGVLKGQNTGKAIVRVATNHVESDTVDFNDVLTKFKKFERNKK